VAAGLRKGLAELLAQPTLLSDDASHCSVRSSAVRARSQTNSRAVGRLPTER
jgi:hypothetical protein